MEKQYLGGISKNQKKVYDFVKNYIQDYEYSPTNQTIAQNVKLSMPTVGSILNKLDSIGMIEYAPKQPIKIIKQER